MSRPIPDFARTGGFSALAAESRRSHRDTYFARLLQSRQRTRFGADAPERRDWSGDVTAHPSLGQQHVGVILTDRPPKTTKGSKIAPLVFFPETISVRGYLMSVS